MDTGNKNGVILRLENVTKTFGGIRALHRVSLSVRKGQIYGLIGPNGAGKTTVFNCISGVYKPTSGEIFWGSNAIGGMSPHRVAELGIGRTFQNLALFSKMTVLDNLLLGRHIHLDGGVFSGVVFWGKVKREEIKSRRLVEEIIDFLEIEKFRKKIVGTLPYGVQKRVELGRALAMKPQLLLLDEPAAGMNVEETEDIARFILDIKEDLGIAMVLVEHDMGIVMDICDHIAVLDFGEMIAEGSAEAVRNDGRVIEAYLGKGGAEARSA